MELIEVADRLKAFIGDELDPGSTLHEVAESDGHAGLTFLFDVRSKTGVTSSFVIKVPPKGVKYRGNTDVYRQAPLLRALYAHNLPVPEVPWAFETNAWFETPFIVMKRLVGRVFFVWDPPSQFSRDAIETEAIWRQCVEQLPAIHDVDWTLELGQWDAVEALRDNVQRWRRIYTQAPDPAWIEAAERVEALLVETLPSGDPVGLFHGDYQPGNILYDRNVLTGIIDWELSGIGAQLQDVGWLMLVCDSANWSHEWRPIHPLSPLQVRQIYESIMGRTFDSLPWYQAFAGFRLASIGCLNVKLHRTGKRHDPVWEHMGRRVMHKLARAEQLLQRDYS